MTRYLLLTIVVLCPVALLPAQSNSPRVRLTDSDSVSDEETGAGDSAAKQSPSSGATSSAANSSWQIGPSADADYTLTAGKRLSLVAEENQDSAESPVFQEGYLDCFREVCTDYCLLPYLGPQCNCETTDCITDQWCDHGCNCGTGSCRMTADGTWVCNDHQCDVQGRPVQLVTDPIRIGWWGVSHSGSPIKVGEFQSLRSSPFYDFDTLLTNGSQTLDLTITGQDQEANAARARYYGPGLKGDVRFQRFQRRLDHDPLPTFEATPPGTVPAPNIDVVGTDLNVGEDYAIRVEQLDARFSGPLGGDLGDANVKWTLNLWGMRKFGERQANAVGHCFNFNAPNSAANSQNIVCHIVSQRQSIDWLTMEVQPGIQGTFGAVSVDYTKTLRSFGQSDGIVDRQYTRFNFSAANNVLGPDYNYGMVPENFTQIDRLKMSAQLTPNNVFYTNLYLGETKNDFRNTERDFSGWDLRLMNTAWDDLTLTAYTSNYEENNMLPETFLNAPPLSSPNNWDRSQARHPVDYQRFRAGMNGRWNPYDSGRWADLSWKGGYEYFLLARDYATYDSARLGVFTQPDSHNHQFELGPSMKWNSAWSTFVTYKAVFSQYPLIGVRESSGRLNTNLPEQSHRTDLGGTWQPSDNFMATAQFSMVTSWHHSRFADFEETNYPLTLNLWLAPTDRWTVSGGYAYFTNWIDQDIGIGFRTTPYESQEWNYSGQNQLVSANTSYALTSTVRVTGGYEWNRGTNSTTVPASISGADWSQLASFFDVEVETQRYTAGVDWQPQDNLDLYLRYNYFDFNDVAANYGSGTAHMALAGISFVR